MTSKEFVLWLKGFSEGVHEYNITPKQWDILKDKLAEVSDETPIGIPIGIGGFGVSNTAPSNGTIHPTYPYRPYEIYCGSGSSGTTITTTPGGGSITYATPQFVTSTATGYPSGSTMSYTTSTWKPEHGPNSPTIQNINESLKQSENDFFGAIDDGGWTPELETQFWSEQPPEPFATPEELAKYNIDSEGFENPLKER